MIQIERYVELWWFDGVNAQNYAEQVTLTAPPLATGTFLWEVMTGFGDDKVNLENDQDSITKQNSNSVGVKSTAASAAGLDVRVRLTFNGVVVDPAHMMTVFAPSTMVRDDTDHLSDATWGYLKRIWYDVDEQFGNSLDEDIEINEAWTTDIQTDYQGTNWRRGSPNGDTVDPINFCDEIGGEESNRTPTPQTPQDPLGATKVQHWGQAFRAGSETSGQGRVVRSHTFRKYRDHADHE